MLYLVFFCARKMMHGFSLSLSLSIVSAFAFHRHDGVSHFLSLSLSLFSLRRQQFCLDIPSSSKPKQNSTMKFALFKNLFLCVLLLATVAAQQQQPDMDLNDHIAGGPQAVVDDHHVRGHHRQLGFHDYKYYTYEECCHYRDMCYNAKCKWYNVGCNIWLKEMCDRARWCNKHYHW